MSIKDDDTLILNDHATMASLTYSNYGVGTAGSSLINNNSVYAGYSNYTITTNGTGHSPWITTNGSTPSTLDVKGDANFEGDIKFKGKSLQELFSKIEDRLSILQPDPAKLEKYEALRKAYEHYKLMEKLIGDE